MAVVYAAYFVTAADKAAANAAAEPYLTSPGDVFSVPLVPLPGPADAEPTHYGGNARTTTDSGFYAALPALKAAFAGSDYWVVNPWKLWNVNTSWYAELAARGLQVRRTTND